MIDKKEMTFDTRENYEVAYHKRGLEKYKNRELNTWKRRIGLATDLIERYRSKTGQSAEEISVLDVGCSIGTFAIECAKLGYKCYGVDFSSSAIDLARSLSKEENVSVEFICADLRDSNASLPTVDVVLAMDVIEHLLDDELLTMFVSIRDRLNDQGVLLFHTFPTTYNPIFFNKTKPFLSYPLVLFRQFPETFFEKVVSIYFSIYNLLFALRHGETYIESIKYTRHCNPITKTRLRSILDKAGFETISMETTNLYAGLVTTEKSLYERFSNQSVAHRNIYGIATKRD